MLNQIKALGCRDEMKIMMAYQTYLELNEIDRLIDVTCHYQTDMDLLYLTTDKNGFKSVYIPVHTSFAMSPSWMLEAQNKLSEHHKKYRRSLATVLNIVLVIRDGDSSSVRYQLSEGLFPPSLVSNRKSKFGECSKRLKLSDSMETKTK